MLNGNEFILPLSENTLEDKKRRKLVVVNDLWCHYISQRRRHNLAEGHFVVTRYEHFIRGTAKIQNRLEMGIFHAL